MITKFHGLDILFACFALFFLSGCGDDSEEEKMAKVSVEFQNLSNSELSFKGKGVNASGNLIKMQDVDLTGGVTPTVFGMKLISVYMVEDMDPETGDNLGKNVVRIWTNPKCDESLTLCGIASPEPEHLVSDYFDFALPTDQVNENLNAQEYEATPGTYRYLRFDFGGAGADDNPDVANMKFGMTDGESHEMRASFTGDVVKEFPEPLLIEEDDSVTVTLSYDIANMYFSSTDSHTPPTGGSREYWHCAGEGDSNIPCIYFTGFSPSASIQ